jgi:hypothetical protein
MQAITTIGLDIAKSVFQVHGVDAAGQVVVRRQLKRRYVLTFFEKLPVPTGYMDYYNAMRTHLSLGKDAPNGRAILRHASNDLSSRVPSRFSLPSRRASRSAKQYRTEPLRISSAGI